MIFRFLLRLILLTLDNKSRKFHLLSERLFGEDFTLSIFGLPINNRESLFVEAILGGKIR